MRNLKRVIAASLAVGMLLLGSVGLSLFLVGMAAFAVLAMTVGDRLVTMACDKPRREKASFYHSWMSMQFLRSGFAMTPMSRSYGGMGRTCRRYVYNVRRVHDGIARRLAGLAAKVSTWFRMYNARDSSGFLAVMSGMHHRESPVAGYT